MTMLLTRMREIADREGFEIEVTRNGKPLVRLHKDGVLGPYPFKRKLGANKTVDQWKKDRFEATYPGFSCKILKGNGGYAAGQTTLKNVRSTYP
jgi:hypothetical protein